MDGKFDHKVSIVMVAFNEAKNIERVLREYHSEVYLNAASGSEYLIYLNGSTDNTKEIVNGLADELSLRVIDAKKKGGYCKDVKNALGNAVNDHIFFSDSSGKHIAGDFWELTKHIEEYDIVSGERSNKENTIYRTVLSWGHKLIVSLILEIPLNDYNTGYKLMKKKVLDEVLSECGTLPENFSTELTARAYKKGFKIKYVPISFKHLGQGGAQFAPKKLPRVIWNQVRAYIQLRREI